jgi:serine/threonine protein kinase
LIFTLWNAPNRDLKPENFLFLTSADDAPVKIIDFGLSRHDDTHLGIMQTKVGTPYYVAPEVLRREYTNSCDIWSIGVITYILLCGYPPFYGDSDTQIFESVRVGRFDFPSPEWDEISSVAKEFVTLLLQKDPKHRYVKHFDDPKIASNEERSQTINARQIIFLRPNSLKFPATHFSMPLSFWKTISGTGITTQLASGTAWIRKWFFHEGQYITSKYSNRTLC